MLDYRPPALKFERVGVEYGGRIVEHTESQRRAYRKDGTGDLMWWSRGKPTEGVPRDPATGEANDPVMRDEVVVDVGEDDGHGETERTIYFDKQRLVAAYKVAARAAGLRRGESDIGWGLYVTCTGTEPGKGTQDAKTWSVRLVPPAGPGVVAGEGPVTERAVSDRIAGLNENERRSMARNGLKGVRDSDVSGNIPPRDRIASARRDDDEPPF